jgi:hypothetical protein
VNPLFPTTNSKLSNKLQPACGLDRCCYRASMASPRPSESKKSPVSLLNSSFPMLQPLPARFKHAYEELFEERGFALNKVGLYVSPVPMPERVRDEGKRKYATRDRARLSLRQQVSASCHNYFRGLLIPSTAEPQLEMNDADLPPLERASRLAQQKAALPSETSSLSFG